MAGRAGRGQQLGGRTRLGAWSGQVGGKTRSRVSAQAGSSILSRMPAPPKSRCTQHVRAVAPRPLLPRARALLKQQVSHPNGWVASGRGREAYGWRARQVGGPPCGAGTNGTAQGPCGRQVAGGRGGKEAKQLCRSPACKSYSRERGETARACRLEGGSRRAHGVRCQGTAGRRGEARVGCV